MMYSVTTVCRISASNIAVMAVRSCVEVAARPRPHPAAEEPSSYPDLCPPPAARAGPELAKERMEGTKGEKGSRGTHSDHSPISHLDPSPHITRTRNLGPLVRPASIHRPEAREECGETDEDVDIVERMSAFGRVPGVFVVVPFHTASERYLGDEQDKEGGAE